MCVDVCECVYVSLQMDIIAWIMSGTILTNQHTQTTKRLRPIEGPVSNVRATAEAARAGRAICNRAHLRRVRVRTARLVPVRQIRSR